MREQPVLHVDPRQGRRQLAQIARRCAHKAAELAEGPMGRRHRRVAVRKQEGEPLRIVGGGLDADRARSEEHTSELQSLMRISYAVFCLKKKNTRTGPTAYHTHHHLTLRTVKPIVTLELTHDT